MRTKIRDAILFPCCLLAAFSSAISAGKDDDNWEIKTRTLFHAPDGSPDSRTQFGIGEWVELKIVPNTKHCVQWTVTGGARLSNRRGTPTIMMLGAKTPSISAVIDDEWPPVASSPVASQSTEKWQQLEKELQTLEKLTDQPDDFDALCDKLYEDTLLHEGCAQARQEPLSRFIQLTNDMLKMAAVARGSYTWAGIQRTTLEESALRLGLCLDETADKTTLPDDFWQLLHACALHLLDLNRQFEAAGGKANSMGSIGSLAGAIITPEMIVEKRKKGIANSLSGRVFLLRCLLQVQLLNAIPNADPKQRKATLIKHGFSAKEVEYLLKDIDWHFDQ